MDLFEKILKKPGNIGQYSKFAHGYLAAGNSEFQAFLHMVISHSQN